MTDQFIYPSRLRLRGRPYKTEKSTAVAIGRHEDRVEIVNNPTGMELQYIVVIVCMCPYTDFTIHALKKTKRTRTSAWALGKENR